jgi:large subunit ribosomal protein L5
LPRVRDFQGLAPSALDTSGNLTIGFKENTIFPEILPEQSNILHGLEITCVTSAKTKDEAFELFKALEFPFKKE